MTGQSLVRPRPDQHAQPHDFIFLVPLPGSSLFLRLKPLRRPCGRTARVRGCAGLGRLPRAGFDAWRALAGSVVGAALARAGHTADGTDRCLHQCWLRRHLFEEIFPHDWAHVVASLVVH